MKRLHLIIFVALLSVVAVGAKTKKQLVVLHTNDVHSCIMPLNENLDNKDLAGRGGFVRRVNMIKEQRALHPDLLFFDSGDFSQGSGYYTLFKGEVEIGLTNFPVVCSNYDFTGTPCEGLVKDYITLKRNGLKIGVFALGAPLKGLVANHNCKDVKFLDPAETAKKYVKLLRKQEKCDVVICLSHLGWEISEYPDQQFIREIDGCDLVLGGHTHTYMPTLEYAPDKTGKMIPDDQNGKHGVFIGKLVLTFQK